MDDSFDYDTSGRQISRTVNGTATTLTWDVSSNLVQSDGAGGHLIYVHDGSGQRVAQVDLTTPTATAYLGSTEVTDEDTTVNHSTATELEGTAFVTATRFYTFGGATVALRETAPTASFSLVLGDQQGSAQVMQRVTLAGGGAMAPAATSDVVTRNAYAPYGVVRGADNLTTDHGWLNQVTDEGSAANPGTGLVYLNARYYDAVASRFLSPDPLMNPQDPRTLDPYRYADNNPIVFHDASGLSAACAGLKGDDQMACYASYGSSAVINFRIGKEKDKFVLGWGFANDKTRRNHRFQEALKNCYAGDSPACNSKSYHVTPPGKTPAWVHWTLDVVGLIPVVGEPADGLNGLLYSADGNLIDAGLSYGGMVPIAGWASTLGKWGRRAAKLGDEGVDGATTIGRTAEACLNSFSGETQVLMADGTTKPISEIVVGDEVLAVNPQTGERGPRKVTAVWVHQDSMVRFAIGGGTVMTTHDHRFWNASDKRWERAGAFDAGDLVLTVDGDLLPVGGLLPAYWSYGDAYNLTVSGLHTYFVVVADHDVLVHNCNWGAARRYSDGTIEDAAQHVQRRHFAESTEPWGPYDTRFNPGSTIDDVEAWIDEALAGTTPSATGIRYDFGPGNYIGTNLAGDPLTAIKIYFNFDGTVSTAFPVG